MGSMFRVGTPNVLPTSDLELLTAPSAPRVEATASAGALAAEDDHQLGEERGDDQGREHVAEGYLADPQES